LILKSDNTTVGYYDFSLDPASNKYITNVFGTDATAGNPAKQVAGTKIEAAYLYKLFGSSVQSVAANYLTAGWQIRGAVFPSASFTTGNPLTFTDADPYDKAVKFNGTSDFLQIGTTPGPITPLLTAGAVMTIEAWVYPTSLRSGGIVNTQPAILCLGATYMNFGVNNGVPTFYWYSGSSSSLASSISITTNTWSHLAVVINGTGSNNLKIYVNGVLGGTGTFVNIPWNTTADGNSLYIGKEGGGTTSWWPGYIDELRITRSARYTANFTPPTNAFNSKSRSN
jgi:hypothetical protein